VLHSGISKLILMFAILDQTKKMEGKENKYQAPALEKGLDILEFLASKPVPLSQTEIAAGIDKNSNEIYRMLVSLENRSYIIRDELSGKYRLSLKLYQLSHRHSPVDELYRTGRLPLEELAHNTMQSCHLSIAYMNQVMVILHAKSPAPIALSIEEGNLFPLPLTASGKVILAYLSQEEREAALDKYDTYINFTAEQEKKFFQSLNKIKEQGFYIQTSDLAEGVVDISVPVGKTETGIMACLTVSRLTTLNINRAVKNEDILAEAAICAGIIQKRAGIISI